jgi:hypothetical protein
LPAAKPRFASVEDAMNFRMSQLFAIAAMVGMCLLVSGPGHAQNAYITNTRSGTVSVINTATMTVIGSPIPSAPGPSAWR